MLESPVDTAMARFGALFLRHLEYVYNCADLLLLTGGLTSYETSCLGCENDPRRF